MRTGLPRPLGDRIRHRFDMAVGRVVKHQKFRHDLLLNGFAPGAAERPQGASTMTGSGFLEIMILRMAPSLMAAPSSVSANTVAASEGGIASSVWWTTGRWTSWVPRHQGRNRTLRRRAYGPVQHVPSEVLLVRSMIFARLVTGGAIRFVRHCEKSWFGTPARGIPPNGGLKAQRRGKCIRIVRP